MSETTVTRADTWAERGQIIVRDIRDWDHSAARLTWTNLFIAILIGIVLTWGSYKLGHWAGWSDRETDFNARVTAARSERDTYWRAQVDKEREETRIARERVAILEEQAAATDTQVRIQLDEIVRDPKLEVFTAAELREANR